MATNSLQTFGWGMHALTSDFTIPMVLSRRLVGGMEGTDNNQRRSETDRRRVRKYRFLDRRTGFDRRKRHLLLGTLRDSEWTLFLVLALVNLMSLADGALTYLEITHGIAAEGNPLLAALFDTHPMAAVAFKIFTIFLVTAIIWHARHQRAMVMVSLFAGAVFSAVLAYHLGSLVGFGLL